MSLADIGLAGQQVDVLNGGDVHPSGRLLSVAEIQHAFRELRQRPIQTSLHPAAPGHASTSNRQPRTTRSAPPHTSAVPDTEDHPGLPPSARKLVDAVPGGRLDPEWIAVIAAHAGAGASCVALAMTDALSRVQHPIRLIEAAHPTRSGLVAAARAELGTDSTGAWRCGSRGGATLYRRAGELPPDDWPELVGADPVSTVVDLGLPARHSLSRLAVDQPTIVLVCRVTVPGVRFAEQLLAELDGAALVLAAVGPRRWPGPIAATLGPRLRQLRTNGQVVTIPHDRGLQLTGPSTHPLPKAIASASRALLTVLESTNPGRLVPTPARPAPRRRGLTP